MVTAAACYNALNIQMDFKAAVELQAAMLRAGQILEALDRKWAEEIAPLTGCESYEALVDHLSASP